METWLIWPFNKNVLLNYRNNKKALAFDIDFSLSSILQVIMAQMEVYEKSLKQAQRFLLRKAEWGGAVLPQPEVT